MSQATQRLAPPSAAGTWSVREVLGILVMVGGGFFLLGAVVAPFSDPNHYSSLIERIGVMAMALTMMGAAGLALLWAGNKLRLWGNKPRLEREAEYQKALKVWQNSWVCNRCGSVSYVPHA